jgi:hypothetical protein
MNDDALALRNRGHQAVDCFAHAQQEEGIVQMFERRAKKPGRYFGIIQSALTQQTRDHQRHAQRCRSGGHAHFVSGDIEPDPVPHHS